MIEHDEPATYGGDAPHVDVPTSIDAANEVFSKLVKRQKLVLILVAQRREEGMTVKEFRDKEKFHHGTASSLFTTLHMRGLLVALQEARNGATVYVLPEYVNGRETRSYRRLARKGLKADIAAIIAGHRPLEISFVSYGEEEVVCSCGKQVSGGGAWEVLAEHQAEEIARIL